MKSMHEEYLKGIFGGVENFLTIVPTAKEKETILLLNSSLHGKVISWDDNDSEKYYAAKYIRIIDKSKEKKDIPIALKFLENIRGIQIPDHLFVPYLNDYSNVKTNSLHVTTENKEIDISGKYVLENIETFIVSGNGSVIFNKNNFPNLRDVRIKLDSKGDIVNEIANYSKLKVLGVSPLSKNHNLFEKIKNLPIEFLHIPKGSINSLVGIQYLDFLTNLWIQELPKLLEIKELEQLPKLEEVTIGYCKNVKDFEILNSMKQLRKINIFGCGSNDRIVTR